MFLNERFMKRQYLEHPWSGMSLMSPRVQVPVADEHAGRVPDQEDHLLPEQVHVVVCLVLGIGQTWLCTLQRLECISDSKVTTHPASGEAMCLDDQGVSTIPGKQLTIESLVCQGLVLSTTCIHTTHTPPTWYMEPVKTPVTCSMTALAQVLPELGMLARATGTGWLPRPHTDTE